MATGNKSIKYNPRERVISTDQNRAQTFSQFGLAEVLRYLMACPTTDDLDAGGNVTESAVGATPLYAKILNGYEVRPQTGAGQLSLQITDGAALVMVDDSDVDASQMKLAVDAGINSNGVLLMTANASGSPRIDVIECEWSTIVTSTDNRDIYDTSTLLFSPASVTKSTQGTLINAGANVRVRAGTPGSGFPGVVAGWLPLAVALVPAGATQCDDMDFWDVRPLVSDRVYNLTAMSSDLPQHELPFVGSANHIDTGGVTSVSGKANVTLGDRRLGGRLRSGGPVADADSLDVRAAVNQEAGLAFPASGLWFLYLATPFGLPRWARYTRTGPRVPRSPRGIPIVSVVPPQHLTGKPTAAIALPTATGLGGTTSSAVMVLASTTSSGNVPVGGLSDGHSFLLGQRLTYTAGVAAGSSFDNNQVTFALVDNTTHPANARAVHIAIALTVSLTVDCATFSASQSGPNFGTLILGTVATAPGASAIAGIQTPGIALANPDTGGAHAVEVVIPVRIPLFSGYPSTTPITRAWKWVHNLGINANSGTATITAAIMNIVGWELGP